MLNIICKLSRINLHCVKIVTTKSALLCVCVYLIVYKFTRMIIKSQTFHRFIPVKSIETYYQACQCWNLIPRKITIVTSETNCGFLHEMNPGFAWLSPWNLRISIHVNSIHQCQTDWHQALSQITTSQLPNNGNLIRFPFLLYSYILAIQYVPHHISVKKYRWLFRLELALWSRIALFLYACYMCHMIFPLTTTGDCLAWNWPYEPVLLYSYMLVICVISYFCSEIPGIIPEYGFMNPYCCILIFLLYVLYHISDKKYRELSLNWLYEPVLLYSYILAVCVISYLC